MTLPDVPCNSAACKRDGCFSAAMGGTPCEVSREVEDDGFITHVPMPFEPNCNQQSAHTTPRLQQQGSLMDRIWEDSKRAQAREADSREAELIATQQEAQVNKAKAAKLREMFADRPETAGPAMHDLKANPSAHTYYLNPAVVGADAIQRPQHYARWAIEPITFIMANDLPFCVGNVVKYVLRYDAKDGRKDLEKAKRYIDMMIEDMDRKAAGTATDVVGKPL